MQLSDIINKKWINAKSLSISYSSALPFSHIVMDNFIKPEILKLVVDEFPNLSSQKEAVTKFENNKEVKFASQGMQILSPSALNLNSYLQSDVMLQWLNDLTGINETLISDPYLSGGGYHEIKTGGFLKIHADFNKHPKINLDRRLNMLIYLNENWNNEWGGDLHLFDEKVDTAVQKIFPLFNRAVIFNTTSSSYHGHPDPLKCPRERSRRSLAYYYYTAGNLKNNDFKQSHSTLFRPRKNEQFKNSYKMNIKSFLRELTPPILIKIIKKIL
jgi:Rps23 Pro-64 3,4-dihydroxylase Tpa1-like proline 4-hydroxylase